MNKVFLTAGIVIIVGVLLMVTGEALYSATTNDYWDKAAYGPLTEWVAEGKKLDQYAAIMNVGLIIMGLGLGIVAFGLATQRQGQVQFREVPSHIPLQQYPQEPQPPQSP